MRQILESTYQINESRCFARCQLLIKNFLQPYFPNETNNRVVQLNKAKRSIRLLRSDLIKCLSWSINKSVTIMFVQIIPDIQSRKHNMNQGFNQIDYESQSFNASAQVKSSRKNRRKIKKIIHNCCVYKQKEDGTHEIILKQFLVSCRLKTAKCLAKKAKEIQINKDNQVAQQLVAEIKRFSVQKQQKIIKQQKHNNNEDAKIIKKGGVESFQNLELEPSMLTFFYLIPTNTSFQMF